MDAAFPPPNSGPSPIPTSHLAHKLLQLLAIGKGEKVAAILSTPTLDGTEELLLLTKSGLCKRTPIAQFSRASRAGVQAMRLQVRQS